MKLKFKLPNTDTDYIVLRSAIFFLIASLHMWFQLVLAEHYPEAKLNAPLSIHFAVYAAFVAIYAVRELTAAQSRKAGFAFLIIMSAAELYGRSAIANFIF